MLRSSHNIFYQPNSGKIQVLTDLLTQVAPYVMQKANQYIQSARTGTKIDAHPAKKFYSDLPFSGTINQIIAAHASAMARSLINKVAKASRTKSDERSTCQNEILTQWEAGIDIESDHVNLNLDQRILSISDATDSHDYWVDIKLPYESRISLPIRKTRHMRQLESRGYKLKQRTLRLNADGSITLSYDKIASKNVGHDLIGIDMGRRRAISRSDGYSGYPLENLLKKIARKKRGSSAYQRAKTELKNAINHSTKTDIDYKSTHTLVLEKLLDMKRNNKWGNRSHHWRIGLLRNRVMSWADEHGVRVLQINPAYTSQTCSGCGHLDKDNRHGAVFLCRRCGLELDADVNAAKVIGQRGVYVSLLRKQRSLVSMGIEPVLTG